MEQFDAWELQTLLNAILSEYWKPVPLEIERAAKLKILILKLMRMQDIESVTLTRKEQPNGF